MLWVVLGVLLLFFGFAAYKSTDVWNGAHIAIASGLFVMLLVFAVLAAANLRTRNAWTKRVAQLTAESEQVEQKSRELQVSIRQYTQELDRKVKLRGQVWRNLSYAGVQGNQITLNAAGWGDSDWRRLGNSESAGDGSAPTPGGESPAAAPDPSAKRPHGMQVQTIVFAFAEAPVQLPFLDASLRPAIHELLLNDVSLLEKDPQGLLRIPFAYLGEYRVTQSEGDQVVLEASSPVSELQQKIIGSGVRWTLYDTMPRDAHDVFESAKIEQLQALFAAMAQTAPASVAGLAAEYARDHQDALPTDPADQRWHEIKLSKERSFEIDGAAGGEGGIPDKPFDVSGRARDIHLRQGSEGPAVVQPEQQGVFDAATARGLVASGEAQLVREVFVRPLRDYAYNFRSKQAALNALGDRASVIQRNLDILRQSQESVQRQIVYRTQEREKLQGDLQGFDQERQVLDAYLSGLEARIRELQQSLKSLYLNTQRTVQGMAG